jgi:hypothetical protein
VSPNDVIPGIDLATVCAGKPRGATFIDDGTNCSPQPGMPCADDNIRVLTDPNPKWTGNLRSSLRYGKITVSGLLDIKKGGSIVNGTRGALYSYGTHKDTEQRALCAGPLNSDCTGNLQAFGTANFYPGPVVGPGAGMQIPIGENWYRTSGLAACPFTGYDEPCNEDGSYVKFRELSLAYTFEGAFINRLFGFTTVDMRVAGRNLKTWTKYKGLDPEVGGAGGNINRVNGYDYFNLPLTRSFVVSFAFNR